MELGLRIDRRYHIFHRVRCAKFLWTGIISKKQDLIEVQQWIIENTELVADYGAYEKALDVVGEHGVVALTGHGMWLHRTPPSGKNRLWFRDFRGLSCEFAELHPSSIEDAGRVELNIRELLLNSL